MPGPYEWDSEHLILGVAVTALSPGATHRTAITGQLQDPRGTSEILQIGSVRVQTTAAMSGLYADVWGIEILSPIVEVPGTPPTRVYPDVAVVPVVDGVALGHVMRIDASAPRNMLPAREDTYDRTQVLIGVPIRKAIRSAMDSIPLKATGLKVTQHLRFDIYSAQGWPGTGNTLVRPLVILVYGDLFTADEVSSLARLGYNGQFASHVPGFPDFRGVHTLKGGPLSPKNWDSLPGGVNQGETKIWRFFRYAYNRVATGASNRFILSRDTSLGGSETYVDTDEDLGFDFTRGAQADDYLRITHIGVVEGANQAFWGVRINDAILPTGVGGTSEGLPVFRAWNRSFNRWRYGAEDRSSPDTSKYYSLPKAPFDLAIYRNKVAFFITPNGTAIAANDASIAVAGVYVQVGER